MERTGSIKEKRVAIDLLEERQKCNFDQLELSHFIYGKEKYEDYLQAQRLLEDDPILRGSEKFYEMSRPEMMENMQQKAKRMGELEILKQPLDINNMDVNRVQMQQGITPLGLHLTMFAPGIKNLSNEKQIEELGEKAKKLEDVLGTYAQTELGHGSNVQGIETTATFDKQTDEFVINSPTISSTKYWPGDSGLHANHAMVFAKLVIDGKSHGVQPFLVQTRDLKTHLAMPGVQGGDVGPKYGYHSKENGWLRFDNVRIPRTNLRMKYVEVDREGNFKKIGDLRNLYSIMLETRVWMIVETPHYLSRGLTIAIRYSAVRRQFSNMDGDRKERKLLDYQTQMHRLAPLLAYNYGFLACVKLMREHLLKIKVLASKNDFSQLELGHHLSAGFKSLFTQVAYDGLETMRQTCGGAGFSEWSGLTYLVQNYAPQTTFEGDNTLMAQQCFRLIMKTIIGIQSGKRAEGFFEYLNDVEQLLQTKCSVLNSQQLQDNSLLEEALKVRAAHSLKKVLTKMLTSSASQNENINSLFGIEIVNMALLHVRYLVFKIMKDQLKQNQIKCPNLRGNLNLLLTLLGVYELSTSSQSLYECGYFKQGMSQIINQALKDIYVKLRPQMVPLIEGFAKSDTEIVSAIGNSYGDIYETQLEWAQNSRLNRYSVLPGIKEHILPILNGKL